MKEKFPGLVTIDGRIESSYSWKHYESVLDAPDREERYFAHIADRDFFRCDERYTDQASAIIRRATKKLVTELHYEVPPQWCATHLKCWGQIVDRGTTPSGVTKPQLVPGEMFNGQRGSRMIPTSSRPEWMKSKDKRLRWRLGGIPSRPSDQMGQPQSLMAHFPALTQLQPFPHTPQSGNMG
ncbi:hypothetical protein GUJ93_ZPchr0004g39430 [Zizania palustris]|uniref:Uncharacterized protein n=1 Tax=Zizania palustris TaxID=103762 RepID=A0A8J5VZ87_ZIZPA|nr:hypothetical protein GUJ93_ZPchr0004g39430 [Zizania palustris]